MKRTAVLFAINNPGRCVFEALLQKDIDVRLLLTRHDTYDANVLPNTLSKDKNIPFEYITTFSPDVIQRIRTCKPDFIISGWFHLKIPQEVIALSRIASVNLHPSLLPAYRGPTPVERCLMNGAPKTGLTLHKLAERFDAGDILWQKEINIDTDENTADLLQRIVGLVPYAIDNLLIRRQQNNFTGHPQEPNAASYYPKWSMDEARIDWRWDAQTIHNRVRAFNPRPLARINLAGHEYCVSRSMITESCHHGAHPGTVITIDNEFKSVTLVCGDGRVIKLMGMFPAC